MLKFNNTEVDLGTQPKSAVIKFNIPGQNLASKPVKLNIKPACGCTSVKDMEVAANKTFTISGTISGRNTSGFKNVKVESPDFDEKYVLTLKYTIK